MTNQGSTFDEIVEGLDFSIERLEALEAAGFWHGFKQGFGVAVAAGGAVGIGVGIGVAIT